MTLQQTYFRDKSWLASALLLILFRSPRVNKKASCSTYAAIVSTVDHQCVLISAMPLFSNGIMSPSKLVAQAFNGHRGDIGRMDL